MEFQVTTLRAGSASKRRRAARTRPPRMSSARARLWRRMGSASSSASAAAAERRGRRVVAAGLVRRAPSRAKNSRNLGMGREAKLIGPNFYQDRVRVRIRLSQS